MLINLKGQGVRSGQRRHPKVATTNAEEHLLSVRHTKLSLRSPSQPSGAWERLKVKGSLHSSNADWTRQQYFTMVSEIYEIYEFTCSFKDSCPATAVFQFELELVSSKNWKKVEAMPFSFFKSRSNLWICKYYHEHVSPWWQGDQPKTL